MLLEFTLENWMSFRDPVTFTMMPDKESKNTYLPKLKDDSNVLPIAAIFGGNASGKSNFIKSLNFARDFIVRGTYPDQYIPVNTFKLEEDYENSPTKLKFNLAIDGKVFSYEFATTPEIVVSESMHEIKGNRKSLLFTVKNGKIETGRSLEFSGDIKNVFKHKRVDQLLLTTVSHLTDIRLPVYTWFLNFVIVQPRDKFSSKPLIEDANLRQHVKKILRRLDCGIDSIGIVGRKSKKNVSSNGKTHGNRLGQYNESDRRRLVTFHRNVDGDLKRLELEEESDGTKRLFELIPVFIELSGRGANCVFVIDEIESSLHTQLICTLVNAYLANCNSKTRTQLIFTTHDVQLMDEAELRKDEIWLAERDEFGVSEMFSVDDFEGNDLEEIVRSSYLVGRFGGKPRLTLLSNQLKNKPNETKLRSRNVQKKN